VPDCLIHEYNWRKEKLEMETGNLIAAGRAATALLLLVAAGCSSISASSESISKIVSSPSTSLSASSSPEDSYKEEVKDFTAAHVQQGGTTDVLLREVGKIAQRHGITNWENSEATFHAIGAGLAKAGKNQTEVDAYKANVTQTSAQAEWLQKGYDAAR